MFLKVYTIYTEFSFEKYLDINTIIRYLVRVVSTDP